MRHLHLLWIGLIGLSGISGCEWLNNLTAGKETDPVFGTPPPRTKIVGSSGIGEPYYDPGDQSNRKRGVIPVVSETLAKKELTPNLIVATVDRTPIFASEVWDRYSGRLVQVRKNATPEQYQTVLRELLKRDLKTHIENRLLVNALRVTFKKKQLEKLDEFIDQAFEEHVEQLKKDFKIDSKAAVADKLAEQGTSLDSLRDVFGNQQMARQFVRAKANPTQIISRPELLRYYDDHRADYRQPAEVRWQEIYISYDKHGGKAAAFRLVEDVVDDLKRGVDFGVVAKKSSDGPTASKNGQWDWTRSGSLADKQVERMLFELRVGEMSAPYAGENAYQLVRINDRHAERFTPFATVQSDIKKTLEEAAKKQAEKKMIDELYKNAVITTIFDREKTEKTTFNVTNGVNP